MEDHAPSRTAGAFVMCGGGTMTVAIEPLLATEATDTIDGLLRIIGHVRDLKTRDPLRTLEDKLLEMRTALTSVE